jgi:DNA (cytosine-5)-methyltransferase 1
LVNNKVIRIQPQHALKIQGFPSDFKLPSSRTEAMKQLGNSVAVDAINACASELISHMNRLEKQKIKKDPMAKILNKGEWTELYTFLKILVDKKLEFCDEDLNPNGKSFKVHKVSTLNIEEMVFLDNDIVTVENETGSKSDVSKVVKKRDLLEIKNEILNNVSTFEIKKAKKIFEELGINIIRGGASNQKADIVLDVSQNKKNFKNEGFGIKSYFWAKPTLLNASGSNTNFIFELINFKEKYLDEINGIETRTKITDRLKKIYDKCSNLKFYKVEADIMNYNLKVLDDELPRLLASLLLNFYINRTNIMSDNLREIFDNELINHNLSLDYKAYTIKVKRFLIAILLGMFPSKKWDGINTSNGIVVVKDDGTQVVFHITKLPILENFLFKNIKFDTPSSTRHRFGSIYKERNGKFYIKLNIQLRF